MSACMSYMFDVSYVCMTWLCAAGTCSVFMVGVLNIENLQQFEYA